MTLKTRIFALTATCRIVKKNIKVVVVVVVDVVVVFVVVVVKKDLLSFT